VPTRSTDANVQVHVDLCEKAVHVVVVERGVQPTQADVSCTRTDFSSTFAMRPATTFVVDINDQVVQVHISQGPPPAEWVRRGPPPRSRMSWSEPRAGLMLSAGVGFGGFGNTKEAACGSVTTCSADDLSGAFTFGVDYWIKPFFAASASYIKPSDARATGSGTGFTFDSQFQTRIVTVGGKAGAPVGHTRVYGQGGFIHHEATSNSTETSSGITQGFGSKTAGWSWRLGGGVEGWMTKFLAIYAEIEIDKLKGRSAIAPQATIDTRMMLISSGLRLRVGR
jgi:hypothetical protein